MTLAVSIAQSGSNNTTFRNRIINGAMMIDQRNAGASVTPTSGQYSVDRWKGTLTQASKYSLQQNAGSVTPPVGFVNYLGATSLSAYSIVSGDSFSVNQPIEGLNVSDLAWGTANAVTVTLSFLVRSSLTGTFGGALRNSAQNRSYPFSFTISAATTWEQKTITITGDTSGTWLTTSGVGIELSFGLGVGSTYSATAGTWAAGNYTSATGATSVVGTSGATFYITGVQLEKGTTATPFEQRLYGTELALCQRYYTRMLMPYNTVIGAHASYGTGLGRAFAQFPTSMRAAPTALEQSGTAADYAIWEAGTTIVCSAVPTFVTANTQIGWITTTVSSGLTVGRAGMFIGNAGAGYLGWSAEL